MFSSSQCHSRYAYKYILCFLSGQSTESLTLVPAKDSHPIMPHKFKYSASCPIEICKVHTGGRAVDFDVQAILYIPML